MRIPKHIAIIPDGNRRWAKSKELQKQEGYQYGLAPGVAALKLAQEYGIEEVTYYGFTVDNCKRPKEQIAAFSQACVKAIEQVSDFPISLLVVGNTNSQFFPTSLLPFTVRTHMNGGGIRVNFLVNYSWEWDLSAVSGKSAKNGLQSKEVSRIDLIIRWGGMRRLSGLLPVQSVYSDFFVVDALWPDFKPEQFHQAMRWYTRQDVTLGG